MQAQQKGCAHWRHSGPTLAVMDEDLLKRLQGHVNAR
jgi:hypothetical protein